MRVIAGSTSKKALDWNKQLAHRLKVIRTIRGLKQGQLSKKAGISINMIRNVESGNYYCSLRVFYKICAALEIEPWNAFSEEEISI